ncbi:unnamed protein product [Bursaphelenchus xylophilus]|uniref:ADP-ribosylation factor 1-like 2 n=1 Tax=Bursaphelenchus xylophilus TaxID=6326 RepID=A0A1I7RQT2_BURXY|nr:unnamed protein product [Bursaphelenchus xylophilus]CAG9113256.1 unnamed protein product [Bursaphelenchus xylophilus]
MIGPRGAGKSSILFKLKVGEIFMITPCRGFEIDTADYKNISFAVWDTDRNDPCRSLWKDHFKNALGLIFVVDSGNRERIVEARYELAQILDEVELRDTVLLVFANKQDLPNAMSAAEITEKLGLHNLRNRDWHVQPTCAGTGDGLYEGLDWLANQLERR